MEKQSEETSIEINNQLFSEDYDYADERCDSYPDTGNEQERDREKYGY